MDFGPVKLCGDDGCCPEVRREGSMFVITDDFGGEVRLTASEAEALLDVFREKLVPVEDPAQEHLEFVAGAV